MTTLLCIPNVSEGRDRAVVEAIAGAVETADLLDVHADRDHHRAVLTLMGPGPAVERDALALARRAIGLIDLATHRGAHPRLGAVDVVPFVPVAGTPMAEAVAAAHRVGEALAAEHGLPVFFYGEAARHPDRRELPVLRRGGLEGLAARLRDPAWAPDAGPASSHPTAGATAVGARGPLIAFNAVLAVGDVAAAQAVARAIRERAGGLPRVRALGFFLASRGLAQVSLNLLDHRVTSPAAAAARIEAEAARHGARVGEYELVGCAPADAFADWPAAGLAPLDLRLSQLLAPGLF